MLIWVIGQIIAAGWFVFDRIFCRYAARRHRSHVSFMRHDRMQWFVNEHPFTVFVLGAGQVSILIGTFYILLSRELFSCHNSVVTASSTVDNLLYVLVQRQVIPANGGAYMLCYGRIGSLSGSSTMAALGAGSLSHFHFRICVCGGTGKFLVPLCHNVIFTLLSQEIGRASCRERV